MSITAANQVSALEQLVQRFRQSTSVQNQSASLPRQSRGQDNWLFEKWSSWAIDRLLREYSGLSVQPCAHDELVVAGSFNFVADYQGTQIADFYELRIIVPRHFPKVIPTVFETAGRIPREFHKLDDGSLCLGSRLSLHLLAANVRTVAGFVRAAVIPYLYGYSYLKTHGELPYGDLRHGTAGLVDDYKRIYRVSDSYAAKQLIRLTGYQKRKANRQSCPCGSGLRVGKCHHAILNHLRPKLGRLWFRDEYELIAGERSHDKPRSS
jgi:hypothetical protein